MEEGLVMIGEDLYFIRPGCRFVSTAASPKFDYQPGFKPPSRSFPGLQVHIEWGLVTLVAMIVAGLLFIVVVG
jgi:hypothetical protein